MNNKQIFVPVDLKFINLDEEDVITTSGGGTDVSEPDEVDTEGWG